MSLRSILVCYRETLLPGKPEKPEQFPKDDEIENKLIIVAVTGIQDPLKDGIPRAVQLCKEADVTVRMVTGDNIDTAIAISKKAGILPMNYEYTQESFAVVQGKTFREMVQGLQYVKDSEGNDVP